MGIMKVRVRVSLLPKKWPTGAEYTSTPVHCMSHSSKSGIRSIRNANPTLIFLTLMMGLFSCNITPSWQKNISSGVIDSISSDARLHGVAAYNKLYEDKIQYQVNWVAVDDIDQWEKKFIKSCEDAGIIACYFYADSSSTWTLHFDRKLKCEEGLILGNAEGILTSKKEGWKIQEIKPGYYWYSTFDNRGDFFTDLFETPRANLFP